MQRQPRWVLSLVGLASLTAGLLIALAGGAGGQESSTRYVLFSGEDNRLNVYDVTDLEAGTFPKQTVIHGGDQGEKDFNAQVCFDPEAPDRFVGGEDTDQPDPPAGWGYFRLTGDRVGEFGWEQEGRFVPTYQPTLVSVPENYGCFFRHDNTMFTTDIGDQFPGFAGTGQLILWYPPFDREDIPYCKIALDLPTPGGIWVDDQDRVYVASNRPGFGIPDPAAALEDPVAGLSGLLGQLDQPFGAVYRYSGDWPTGPDAAGGCGRVDGTGAQLVDDGRITRETFITPDALLQARALTPSAIWPSGTGTFYVSSVFTGVIAEFDQSGAFVRQIMAPPPTELLTMPFPSTGTPYGIIVDDRGTIFYADLGVGLLPVPGPVGGEGTVRFITFDDAGNPRAPVTIEDGLDFPDGVGLRTFTIEEAEDPDDMPTTGGGLILALIGLSLLGAALLAGRLR